jgi:hypothetical protein
VVFFDYLLRSNKKYFFFYFLILLQLLGGIAADISIIISSFFAFVYFSFNRHIDLYVIFLLLLTSIVMGENSFVENVQNINVEIYSRLKNTLFIGPVALSVKLALALSVPVRLLIQGRRNGIFEGTLFWFLILIFAIVGLVYSIMNGYENKSGLTVGLRICLSLGVLFLPTVVLNRLRLQEQLDRIFLLSLFFLAFGLMNAHWIFITFGFLPYLWVRWKSFLVRSLIIVVLSNVFILGPGTTITIILILLSSLFFVVIVMIRSMSLGSIKKVSYVFAFLPLLITMYILYVPFESYDFDFSSFWGYFNFKLIGDRKPIWDASLNQILSAHFLIPHAGSSLEVYFDYIKSWVLWEEGSHNIFLEIGRQVSGLAMVFFIIVIPVIVLKQLRSAESRQEMIIVLSFTSIYITFGISGQSIVYDGVGFLYWLMISQFIRQNRSSFESTSFFRS